MFLARWLSIVLFGAMSCVALCAEPAVDSKADQLLSTTSEPKTVSDVLQLLHALARNATYQRDEFYATAVMHRLFGQQVAANAARGEKISIVSMHGFADLVAAAGSPSPTSPGIWFEARKANNDRWFRMDVTFRGAMPGLGFEEVVASLGPGWKRDPKAEARRDTAIMTERFNPPLPKVSHPMGRAIILYPAGTSTLVLEFDPEGKLQSARSAGGCLGQKNCTA